MSLTDAMLKGLCAQALNMAKRDLEQKQFNFLLATYHSAATPPLYRMTIVEQLIIEKLGENWLNSGWAKDAAFGVFREAVDLMPPEAVIFATAANMFKGTEKLDAIPEAAWEALLNAGHDEHHKAVKSGHMVLVDCIIAVAQTPERVCHYTQEVKRGRWIGAPNTSFFRQEDFRGRLKMFGKEIA